MDGRGESGSGRRALAVLRAASSGSRPHRPGTWPGRPGVDQEQAEVMTDGPPPLRLAGSFDVFYQEEYSGLVQLAFVLSGSRSGAEDIA